MRRLRPLDRILLPLLFSVWALAFALHLKELIRGRLAWAGVYVSTPAAGEPPVVRGFWPGMAAENSGLAVGDRLLSVGGDSLLGVGPIGFTARVYSQANADLAVSVRYERGVTSGEVMLPLTRAVAPWRILPLVVTMAATGALVLLRVPDEPIGRAFFLAAISYAINWTLFPGGPPIQTYFWAVLFALSSLVQFPFWLRAALIFPPETAPARQPWWPWLFAAFGPTAFTWVFGTPLSPAIGASAGLGVNIAFMVTILAVAAHNLLRASPVGRRQFKWVACGVWVGILPPLVANLAAWMNPAHWWWHDVASVALVAVPLSFLIAIVRFNLFDIDRLVAATALYSLLSFIFIVALLTVVPRGGNWICAASGLDPGFGQLLVAGVVAGGMLPGQRALRPRMERLFFSQRVALRDGVDDLLRKFRTASDADQLLDLASERLDTLLQPERCILYRPDGPTYRPSEHDGGGPRGRPAPPLEETLIADLGGAADPIDLQGEAATPGAPSLPDSTRLLFEALGIVTILPIRRGQRLVAFLALGQMRSGDVYTTTDLALLGAVASALSTDLVRIDLGRYAPRPIIEAFERDPQALAPAEREVTILFSDIRGSTGVAEAVDPATLRSLQEEYFAAMEAAIEGQHGLVVKTIGDAVMALWNTPAPLPDHPAHACAAALEMLDALAPFNARWAARGAPPIAIRIGIHTGAATVGNFGTAQRLEYDARGDAVNLASRLEGLGKQYGATLLISEATRACLDSQFACREIDRVRVLGRGRPVGVHEVLGRDAPDAWLQSWDDALSSYRARAWEEAIARFEALVRERPEDGPAQTYLERCRQLSAVPPPTDWDGVFDAHAK